MERTDSDETQAPPREPADADGLYGVYYFGHGCGRPYVRDEGWLGFFSKIAERIVAELDPSSVLDAGCAMGFLVEGLRSRGVDANGLDISAYAIGQTHESIRPFCQVGSVTDPLPRRFELIVCIEVLEHLTAQDAERAVECFCNATDDVLFSSTPIDYKEATHFNVQQPEYWAELFARHGLHRDLDFDASFITPWAALYRRRKWSTPRVVAGYERRIWNLMKEVQGCREIALEQRMQLGTAETANRYHGDKLAEMEAVARQQAEAEADLKNKLQGIYRALENERSRHAATAHALARVRTEQAQAVQTAEYERARSFEHFEAARAAQAHAGAAAHQAQRLAERLAYYEHALDAMNQSGAWAMARAANRVRAKLAPTNTRRHRAVRVALQAARVLRHEGIGSFTRKSGRRLLGHTRETHVPHAVPAPPATPEPLVTAAVPVRVAARGMAEGDYATWIARHEPDAHALELQKDLAGQLGYRPLISVVTPVFDTPRAILEATIASVVEQTYDHWELCLADGGSSDPGTIAVLNDWAARDERVRVERLECNLGIAGNSNAALAMARGEFVALLDHDDLLAPWALYEVARRLNADATLDFLYSDKDRITEDGTRRFSPFFKPCWSPEVMLSANYLTHLCVARTALARAAGGFRSETEGAQDWDFFLRMLERTDRIAHIPQVLYHWRVWSRSVASGMTAKPYAYDAQRRTLEDHLRRTGQEGVVRFERKDVLRVHRGGVPQPTVSIIISTRGSTGHLPRLLQSLQERTEYASREIIVVHSGPKTPQLRDYYADLAAAGTIRVLEHDGDPGSWAARNLGAELASGERLLFLAESLEPLNADWLREMVEWSTAPGIGVVGAKILRTDGTIEHAGLVAGLDGLFGPVFDGMREGEGGIFGDVDWYRNYSAVSGDCLMIPRDLFATLGGFDADLAAYGGDVDLCLRTVERGLRIVFTPFARLERVGVRPLPGASGLTLADAEPLHARCRALLASGDPYYNPNLSLAGPLPGPAATPESRAPGLPWQRTIERLRARQTAVPVSAHQPPHDIYSDLSRYLVSSLDFTTADAEASRLVHDTYPGPLEIRSLSWFIPDFQNAFYGGIYTILRFASYLKRSKGVVNRFYLVENGDETRVRAAIARAFPNLYGELVQVIRTEQEIPSLEESDACVATYWGTAYYVLKYNRTRRKFFFLQDYEPLFYPASSTSGLAEASYRFGFYGLANTIALKEIYEREYGGRAASFTPCVDTELFQPRRGAPGGSDGRYKVFFYGRPNNPRNGFELGTAALRRLKKRMGQRVQIVAAGDVWKPAEYGLEGVVENLGLLTFEETAALYRTCDAGLVLMFTRHPSYLPFEFMASGCLVVTNRNAATAWLLKDEGNCLLAEASVECIAEALERGLTDQDLRERITAAALKHVHEAHADWGAQIEKMYAFMCDPDSRDQPLVIRPLPRPEERLSATG